MSRRAARTCAVEVLYAADVRGAEPQDILTERAGEAGVPAYGSHLVGEVSRRRGELDAILEAKAVGWPVARMSPVDRNILRVAVLELLEADVPPAVAIDEAVDLAKMMSGPEAARFVNGVLAAVLGELQSSEAVRGSADSS